MLSASTTKVPHLRMQLIMLHENLAGGFILWISDFLRFERSEIFVGGLIFAIFNSSYNKFEGEKTQYLNYYHFLSYNAL